MRTRRSARHKFDKARHSDSSDPDDSSVVSDHSAFVQHDHGIKTLRQRKALKHETPKLANPIHTCPGKTSDTSSQRLRMLGSFAANATLEDVRTRDCHAPHTPPPQLRSLLIFNEARVRKWKAFSFVFSGLFAAVCLLLLGALRGVRALTAHTNRHTCIRPTSTRLLSSCVAWQTDCCWSSAE